MDGDSAAAVDNDRRGQSEELVAAAKGLGGVGKDGVAELVVADAVVVGVALSVVRLVGDQDVFAGAGGSSASAHRSTGVWLVGAI